MGYYCMTILWIVLTLLFLNGVIFSMLSPAWFENGTARLNSTNKHVIISFGLLRYSDVNSLDTTNVNKPFYFKNFYKLPSISWIVSLTLYSVGTALLSLSFLLSVFELCMNHYNAIQLKIGTAFIQLTAVGLLCISVLTFPLGLDSKFSRNVCGPQSLMYSPGDCQLAWGYTLSIMSIALSIFLPVLAKYTADYDVDNNNNSYTLKNYDEKSEITFLTASSFNEPTLV